MSELKMKFSTFGQTTNSLGPGSRFRLQLILVIIGGIGIIAIFIPFTWSVSPIDAAFYKDTWRLAWPAFLPPLITIISLRWLKFNTLSRAEKKLAYLAAIASIGVTLSFYLETNDGWPGSFREWLSFVFPFITLGFGILALLRSRQHTVLQGFRPIMSLQFAYLANMLLCLTGFLGEWNIGAYFSLVTVIAYLTQMLLIFRYAKRNITFR